MIISIPPRCKPFIAGMYFAEEMLMGLSVNDDMKLALMVQSE